MIYRGFRGPARLPIQMPRFRLSRCLLLLSLGLAFTIGGSAAASGQRPCEAVRYHSGMAAQRMCMDNGVVTHGTDPGTYLFATPGNGGTGIYASNGNLVWWNQPPSHGADYDASVVHWHGQPYLAVWIGRQYYMSNGKPINEGTVVLYNEHYQQVGDITAVGPFYKNVANVPPGQEVDPHEFRITPQGDALIDIVDPVMMRVHGHEDLIENFVVQKLSLVQSGGTIHTGKLLFQWQSLQHVPLSQSHERDPGNTKTFWDYFHGNSVSQDSDGNLIVSSRNTWGIFKINVKTGKTMWQVGAKADSKLRTPWCYQHDVTALGHDEYSLFDDGGSGPECNPGRNNHPSRGLIIKVNPSKHPAGVKLIRAYVHHPLITSSWLGSAQVEPGGDFLVGYGDIPAVTEFSQNGKHVKMDLTLSSASYRTLRFPWVGMPTWAPTAGAKLQSGGTEVWASWNGSTQVAAWRVKAGASSTALLPVSRDAKKGFETAIFLKRPYAEVAVQALGSSGQVLATSNPVASTG